MRLLVTGGTGYLGRAVVPRLLAAGHDVRCLVRARSDRSALPPAAEPRAGDVTDLPSYLEAARGCDAIVHLAAMVRLWHRDPAAFLRVNAGGVVNAIRAGVEAKVGRVLVCSSFVALGPTDGAVRDESGFRRRTRFGNRYEETKYLGALLAREAAGRGAPVVILYPGVVYGPGPAGQASLVTNLLRSWLRGGWAPLLAGGRPRWCLAWVDDVAEGFRLALERAAPGSEYILGGENASLSELFALARELSGLRPRPFPVPVWAAKGAGLLELAGTLFGREPREVTPGAVEVVRHDWAFSSEKARHDLGYPVTPLREGIRATVAWMRREGMLPEAGAER